MTCLVCQQHEPSLLKQTVLVTSPSSTVGCFPFNQPGALALQRFVGGQISGRDVPAFLTKRYHLYFKSLSHSEEDVTQLTSLHVPVNVLYELHAGKVSEIPIENNLGLLNETEEGKEITIIISAHTVLSFLSLLCTVSCCIFILLLLLFCHFTLFVSIFFPEVLYLQLVFCVCFFLCSKQIS